MIMCIEKRLSEVSEKITKKVGKIRSPEKDFTELYRTGMQK